MTDHDIIRMGACEIAAAVRGRRLTATQVMKATVQRTERLEPLLNSYAHFMPGEAMAQAAAIDRRIERGEDAGPLAGVPVSVKDLIAVAGAPQEFGSRLFAGNIAQHDAPAVSRLRAAGACITGKTTTSELGSKAVGDSPLTGTTRNPWNTAFTPGGSSAGAACGVAAGLVPVALGTDGGGSIRIPAALCGLTGFKAQYGRVPVWPPSATPGLAHVGPLARNLRDIARVLAVICGPDPRDASSAMEDVPAYEAALHEPVAPLRLGWCVDFGEGGADADVLAACMAAIERLRSLGCTVLPVPPWLQAPARTAWAGEFYAGIAQRIERIPQSLALIDPALRRQLESLVDSKSDPEQLRLHKSAVTSQLQAVFETVDVLLSPTLPVAQISVGQDTPDGYANRGPVAWSHFTYAINLAGNPAASVPVGFSPIGMPIGLQIIGRPGFEGAVLRVAAALQGASSAFAFGAINRIDNAASA